jgi:hypothetical protein
MLIRLKTDFGVGFFGRTFIFRPCAPSSASSQLAKGMTVGGVAHVDPSRVCLSSAHSASANHSLATLSRDYLDENGGGQSEFEAAAGSEVMIGLSPEVRKHFFWVSVFDCR